MENEIDLDNLTKQDFMEMATYVAMSEKKNVELLEELRKHKAYLSATLQQRNSAEQKYQNLLADKALKTVPITEAVVVNASIDLINPEQWAVPKGKVITTPKSDKI
jgi:hypothetical protein